MFAINLPLLLLQCFHCFVDLQLLSFHAELFLCRNATYFNPLPRPHIPEPPKHVFFPAKVNLPCFCFSSVFLVIEFQLDSYQLTLIFNLILIPSTSLCMNISSHFLALFCLISEEIVETPKLQFKSQSTLINRLLVNCFFLFF